MPYSSGLNPDAKIQLLLQISRAMGGSLDLDHALNELIDAVRPAVPYDGAGIFILKDASPSEIFGFGSHMIAGMAMRGFPDRPREDDPMLKSGEGIVGWVIRTGERVVVPDVRLDPRYVEGRPTTLSETAVPIFVEDRIIGALNLESDRLAAYSDADAELLQLISTAAALSIEKAILHRRVMEQRRIENQLDIARGVHKSLLPERPPPAPGYDIAAAAIPNSEVGGDYYDYIPLAAGHLGLVVADVSGKGVPAALIMASFRAALRTQLRHDPDISSGLEAVNTFLVESIGESDFVTAFCAKLDLTKGQLHYVNCGHNPPLLLRRNAGTESLFEGGVVLGFVGGAIFPKSTVRMHPGDILVLYTDGVVENNSPTGEEFEPELLETVVRENSDLPAPDIVRAVIDATQTHSLASAYADDFTLVIVKRLG